MAGFTIVEAIVTLAVVGIFLTGFFQSYILLESQRVSVARQAAANDVAYSNLRKFTSPPAGVTCSLSGSPLVFTPETVNGSGAMTQTVTAIALDGCDSDGNFIGRVKIQSKVIYDRGKEVIHASIVN